MAAAEAHGPADFLTPEERVSRIARRLGGTQRRWIESARELVGAGDAVWALGASPGVFAIVSALLARSGGSVLAIVAERAAASELREARDHLRAPDARLDVLELDAAGGSPGGCDPANLDRLLDRQRAPTLVRLDLPGEEMKVLAGAGRLLTDVRPILLVTVTEPTRAAVGGLLQRGRYQLFDAFTNPADRLRLELPAGNTLAIPGRLASA